MKKRRYFTLDGLDATGKTTLVSLISKKYRVDITRAPLTSWEQLRPFFEEKSLWLRFGYFALGNILTDTKVRLTERASENTPLLQDRSWLTTLSAHELRGLNTPWLSIGKTLAKKCSVPDLAIIIHVDTKERYQRLRKRAFFTITDKQNLRFENKMEKYYLSWASRLGWRTYIFDNTYLTAQEAATKLAKILKLEKC